MESLLQRDFMHAMIGEVTDGYVVIDVKGAIFASEITEIAIFKDGSQQNNIWNVIKDSYKTRLKEMIDFISQNQTKSSYFIEVEGPPRVIYQVKVFPFQNLIGIVFWDVTVERNVRQVLEENYRSISLLHDTAEEVIHQQTPQQLLDSLFDRISEELDLDIYLNYRLDSDAGKIHLMNHKGISPDVAKRIEWLELGQAVSGTVAQQEIQIYRENIPKSTDPKLELIKSLGVKAYACHPLYSNGRLLGTLSFGSSQKESFNSRELELLEKICDQITESLEKSFLISELQEYNSAMMNMNAKLQEQQQKLSNIFEGAIDGIIITDQNFTMVDANSAALHLLEAKGKEQLPLNFFNLFSDEEKPLAKKYANELVEFGKVYGEIPIYSLEGRKRVVGFSGVMDINPDHNLIIFRDITHQKVMEQQLIEVKNEAERANKIKTDFLLEMSHEFRTPLNTVIGYSELLQELAADSLSDQEIHRLERINDAGQELLSKVNHIINYIREDHQERELSYHSIRMSTLFDQIYKFVHIEADQNQVQLDFSTIEVDLIRLYGDQEQLFQALKELIRNGIQYNYPGGFVQVKAYLEEDHLMIEITDSGQGLSEMQITHIHDPLHHDNIYGIGMGLSIAFRIIHELKGTLSVLSEGEGSTFTISLPVLL